MDNHWAYRYVALETRLVSSEDFEYQRGQMKQTIDQLKELINSKEDAYKKALDQMEIALIVFKDRWTDDTSM